MTSNHATGSCLCGAVVFDVAFPTLWSAHCHCSMCRRAHGAAFVTWVGVTTQAFALRQGQDILVDYESSPGTQRSFCGRCGTPMLFRGARWPDQVHIARACFVEPLDRAVSAHVFFDERVPWIEITDGLPRRGGPNGMTPLD